MIKNVGIVINVFVCIGLIGSVHAADKGIVQEVRDHLGKKVTLMTPFPYRHLTTDPSTGLRLNNDILREKNIIKQTVFVPEGFYTVIGKGLSLQQAVVGPLCPCVLIAIRDKKNDRSIIFHSNGTTCSGAIAKALSDEFGNKIKSEDLTFKFFSRALAGQRPDFKFSPAAIKQEFDYICKTIPNELGVKKSKGKVEALFYNPDETSIAETENYLYTQNIFFVSDRTLVLDKDLNINSTSYLNENLFARQPGCPKDYKKYLNGNFYDAILDFYQTSFVRDEKGNIMDMKTITKRLAQREFGFFKIEDLDEGLGWLPIIAAGYVKNLDELKALPEKTFTLTLLGKELLEAYKPA